VTPPGAPNVLVILLDDVGFGASSAFGGPCHTPTAEGLAAGGLKYTHFHTTALCSPTRAAGRNHHAVGTGAVTKMATASPGYSSLRPNTCAPLAETLRLNGTYRAPAVGGELGTALLSLPMFEAWSVRDGRCVERWLHVDRSACAGLAGSSAKETEAEPSHRPQSRHSRKER
jgi:Sulfatase